MNQRDPRGVLDTSTLIELGTVDNLEQLPAECLITTITLAEPSVGPLVARTAEERAARQAHLQAAEADLEPLPSRLSWPGAPWFGVASTIPFGRSAASSSARSV